MSGTTSVVGENIVLIFILYRIREILFITPLQQRLNPFFIEWQGIRGSRGFFLDCMMV